MAYRVDEEVFNYNKDSDEWFCATGKSNGKESPQKQKSGKQTYKYYIEKEKCRPCPLRNQCIKGTPVGRTLEVGINTPEFYGYSQEKETDEFKEKYKKMACQEWKNGEMKNYRGLDRAGVRSKKHGLTSKINRFSSIRELSRLTDIRHAALRALANHERKESISTISKESAKR